MNLKDLLELRDRALISIIPSNDSNKNDIFIKIVSDILKVYNSLNDIYDCGYIKEIKILIDINDGNHYFTFISNSSKNQIDNIKYNNVESILLKLRDIIKKLKSSYKKGYK